MQEDSRLGSLKDTRLMARALSQRWPLTSEKKSEMMEMLYKVVTSGEASPREITSAARALISAEAQNQADEHKVVDIATGNDRILEIAKDLGIDPNLIVDGQAASDTGIEGNANSGAIDG